MAAHVNVQSGFWWCHFVPLHSVPMQAAIKFSLPSSLACGSSEATKNRRKDYSHVWTQISWVATERSQCGVNRRRWSYSHKSQWKVHRLSSIATYQYVITSKPALHSRQMLIAIWPQRANRKSIEGWYKSSSVSTEFCCLEWSYENWINSLQKVNGNFYSGRPSAR